MSNLDREIQEIVAAITRLVDEAYKRGETDALERVVRLARSDPQAEERAIPVLARAAATPREERRRAPKGSVEALVTRALGNGSGKLPDEIKALAASDDERMIAVPSIRAHLRKGEKEGRYWKKGSRWYAANSQSVNQQEAAEPVAGQAASGLWPNQEDQS